MSIRYFTLLFFICLILPACNQKEPIASCSSEDTQKLIGRMLTEQTEKLTVDKKYDYYDGTFVFGASKIRALLDQIQVVFESIGAVKDDSNNRDKVCGGLLKVTIPMAMLDDVNQVRDAQHQIKIAQYAMQLNIKSSNNVFTQEVSYTVKPAGDGKESHIEFESTAWVKLLDEITTDVLLKPTLETQDVDPIQFTEQPKQDVKGLKPDAGQARLETNEPGTIQQKQGLDKLNKELLEAEQVQKELLQERSSQSVTMQSSQSSVTVKKMYPSFNCNKATRSTEIAICENEELASLDVKNMKLYIKAKSRDIDDVATKEVWKKSIKSKYACGSDVDCIREVYKESISGYECIAAGKEPGCDAVSQ